MIENTETIHPNGERRTTRTHRIARKLIWLFYPKDVRLEGEENLPKESCIIVGNHARMNGPILSELYFPGDRAIWTAGEMFRLKDVPAYAFQDFWSGKPKWTHPFYRVLSYLIAPLAVCIFNHAHTIPVYHDARSLSTFRTTVARLTDGARVIIFPEHAVPHDHIVNAFQEKFVEVARLYHKRTGKRLAFVPMYVAPALHACYLGEPVYHDPTAPKEKEDHRIASVMMDRIRQLAESLPLHTVVPYDNAVKKQDYPKNRPEKVSFRPMTRPRKEDRNTP